MKKFYLLAFILISVIANAQEKRVVKDDFESNRFQWDEFFEKGYSGSIQDGYYVLENKEKGLLIRSIAELPISVDRNFKITFKFLIPKLNDSYFFGIVYNFEDENNYSNFLVSEKKFRIYNIERGTLSISRQSAIILKAGKNVEVVIEMEKKGNKLIFSVNNMEVVAITKRLDFNAFGFQVEHDNTIKVDEVIIEQVVRD